ncbi:uncharacterized protein LOC121766557 [Salvia splendens]|uniref:uncharacterized protein LOC121766557 n=1 Tax=Salvia splendens TaxID=180675 RepID=UPI001C27B397|nr:uncharacterized protein LOC121766557 [Salvia splendens]XP_042018757.1 uncharacterized protein LOC121766557 [Salvia splendens]XP_042018758.1 uncharacterized protein LOC121766557 [Salvia splendens]XP_042018759.1 uncharacterized protein LOC121766557 [Salvia splendens]XP_042018760.1 uncharacterized protein LOC121766557 [Salvia splendens]
MHQVLGVVLNLHEVLLAMPAPVLDDCKDHRWKWFKGYLGALDGTHINFLVSNTYKPQFRSKKEQISTNTLVVCDRNMQFVYVLLGWEGSAGDSRVLRDAVTRVNGLKVPKGCYYWRDNGYTNSEGFLKPYRGVRYHLMEWAPGTDALQNAIELFNMRHSKAMNVIERVFVVLKMRSRILQRVFSYPIKMQIRLIMAWFMLHNFIRREMEIDPIEVEIDDDSLGVILQDDNGPAEFVEFVEPSNKWHKKA